MMLSKSIHSQKQTRLSRLGRRRNQFRFGRAMADTPMPALAVDINPPGIVAIDASSFTINANKMKTFFPYIVEFQSVRYLIWKDERNTLIETVLE